MVDFTSALYLGFAHAHGELDPWDRLTTGVPAALREPEAASEVAGELAALVGTETAMLWPSTLHVFMDVLTVLAKPPATVVLDRGVYPVARWGASAATAVGSRLSWTGHYDPPALADAVARLDGPPIAVVDGFCPGCGRSAPLSEYIKIIEGARGVLIVDDTQALGVLGSAPRPEAPYGDGGGGSLRRQAVLSGRVLWVASLAKGFGAPVAALGASHAMVERLRRLAPTRVHSSPPSAASIAAARRALARNRAEGDARRDRLASNVRALRESLYGAGLSPAGGVFPVQRVALETDARTAALHRGLRLRDVGSALVRARCTPRLALMFLVTAAHTATDAVRAGDAVKDIARRNDDVDDGGWFRAPSAGFPAP